MTTFVHCRGCGVHIHETAATCPKCGALQVAATQASATSMAPLASPPSPYGQIPWFRRRWVLILIALLLTPVAAVIAWTGETYYLAGATVKTFPKSAKIALACAGVAVLVAIGSEEEVLQSFVGFFVIGVALGMAFKK